MKAIRCLLVVGMAVLAVSCSKAYVAPDSGPRAALTLVTQETRGSVGYMSPQECRDRKGSHPIAALSDQPAAQTWLPGDQDAVLTYDYDQPEHLGPVGPLTHCHVAFAFHAATGGSYRLRVGSTEECKLGMEDAAGKPVPGVLFAADRCNSLQTPLLQLVPGFPPPSH